MAASIQRTGGNARPVSIEQVADIIVVAAARQHRPAGFDALRAARQKAVLTNPEGMFPWDQRHRATASVGMGAQQFHPSRFKHIDLIAKTIAFYREFLAYDLKEQEALRIIAGLPPVRLAPSASTTP